MRIGQKVKIRDYHGIIGAGEIGTIVALENELCEQFFTPGIVPPGTVGIVPSDQSQALPPNKTERAYYYSHDDFELILESICANCDAFIIEIIDYLCPECRCLPS